jgi:hypothetical protein
VAESSRSASALVDGVYVHSNRSSPKGASSLKSRSFSRAVHFLFRSADVLLRNELCAALIHAVSRNILVRLSLAAIVWGVLIFCAHANAQEWGVDARTGQPATFATGAFGAERLAKPPQVTIGQPEPVLIVDPISASRVGSELRGESPTIVALNPKPYRTEDRLQMFEAPAPGSYNAPVAYNTLESPMLAPGSIVPECYECANEPWRWQVLPPGIIYHSYLAGPKEPRFGGILFNESGGDNFLDGTLGARIGLLRYGDNADFRPQGWQLDVEGAAIIRQDLSQNSDVDAYDFRIGVPLTYGVGRYQMKIAWYHVSSHLGDEFAIKHPDFPRLNFSRNAIVWGHSFYVTDDLRIYGEVDYAYWTDGGAEPWLFQTGFEYSPVVRGARGAPFLAMNGLLQEENDFGGPFTLETGWQWRPWNGGQLLRLGFHYQTGPSIFGQFFRDSEEQIGAGLWYDF